MRTVSYHPSALAELSNLFQSLARIHEPLASAFIDSVERKLLQALDHPMSGSVYLDDIRKLTVRRFKVLLLYGNIPTGTGVAAVVDARRDPHAIRRLVRSR
jgi:plasmid stabilization system protein ParE